jgi:Putative bacterial sensory transduction regulator
VTKKKRLECLEALMAVNYRIAMGKFGLDLDDGEVRLEEAIPLADDAITFEQFQLALGALMQTVAMYHSLLPRIVYGNLSVLDALNVCEQEFLQEIVEIEGEDSDGDEGAPLQERELQVEPVDPINPIASPELNANDALAEITRMLEEHKD